MDKSLSSKYGQTLLDTTKISATDALKTASKSVIQKIAEATGRLVGNKTTEKIANATSNSTREDPSKSTVPAQIDETSTQSIGIPKERYIIINICSENGVSENHKYAVQHK